MMLPLALERLAEWLFRCWISYNTQIWSDLSHTWHTLCGTMHTHACKHKQNHTLYEEGLQAAWKQC